METMAWIVTGFYMAYLMAFDKESKIAPIVAIIGIVRLITLP